MTAAKSDDGPQDLLVHVRTVENRVDGLEQAMVSLGKRSESGFREINTELRKLTARLAESPQYRVGEVLDVITKAAGLLALASYSIIWIATSISAAPTAEIRADMRADRDRLLRIERLVERGAERRVSEVTK